jgi:hypothetical protein
MSTKGAVRWSLQSPGDRTTVLSNLSSEPSVIIATNNQITLQNSKQKGTRFIWLIVFIIVMG